MRRQRAGKHHSVPLGGGHLKIPSARGTAAAARREADVILDIEIDGSWARDDLYLPAVGIGDEFEVDRLEIHHQRIGQDVVGAIRPPVEGARILAAYGEGGVV